MIASIEIEKLSPHPKNPRKNLGDIEELTKSIKAFGVLQNLTVVPDAEDWHHLKDPTFTVICGHRRLAAAKKAGLVKIPCSIVEMDEKEQISAMLLENMQRSDLTLQEEAQGFQMMLDLGSSIREIVKKTGMSETKVRHRVKLNELDQDKLEKVMGRNITIAELIRLEKIKDPETRNRLLEYVGTNQFDWKVEHAEMEEKKEFAKTEIERMLPDAEITGNWSQYPAVCSLKYSEAKEESVLVFVQTLAEKSEEAGAPPQAQFGYTEVIGRIMKMPEKEETKKKDPEEEKKGRQRAERMRSLKGMRERIEDRVCKWIGKISEDTAKKKEEGVLPMAMEWIANGYYADIDPEDVMRVIGVEAPEQTTDNEEEFNAVWREACEVQPHRVLIVIGLMAMLPSPYNEWWDYDGRYREGSDAAEGIKAAYKYLDALGYKAADEELAFIHGESDMYLKEEGKK